VHSFTPRHGKEDDPMATILRSADALRLAAAGEQRSALDDVAPKVTTEGSQYVSSRSPGKKWHTLEQAISYTVTQRES
jgi:hypothetical protein